MVITSYGIGSPDPTRYLRVPFLSELWMGAKPGESLDKTEVTRQSLETELVSA